MSRFLTLLKSGKHLHLQAGMKVIPKEELGELLSAMEMVDRVKEDLDGYRKDVEQEAHHRYQAAEKEGYEAGFHRWVELIAQLEGKIQEENRAIRDKLVPIALKAAKKIIGREIEISDAIVDIVMNKLKEVSSHKQIILYVNSREIPKLQKRKEELVALFEKLESFSLRGKDDLSPGSFIIETDQGIMNGQIERMWEIIEENFQR